MLGLLHNASTASALESATLLLQALPLPDSNHSQSKAVNHTTNGTASRDFVTDSMLNVVPHALDDHVPALYGPLQAGDLAWAHMTIMTALPGCTRMQLLPLARQCLAHVCNA